MKLRPSLPARLPSSFSRAAAFAADAPHDCTTEVKALSRVALR